MFAFRPIPIMNVQTVRSKGMAASTAADLVRAQIHQKYVYHPFLLTDESDWRRRSILVWHGATLYNRSRWDGRNSGCPGYGVG